MIGGAPQPLKVPLTQTVLTPGMNVLLAIWLAMSTRNVTNVLACDADADATSQTTHSALARFVIFSTANHYVLDALAGAGLGALGLRLARALD